MDMMCFDLKCEGMERPACIDVEKPLFSWKLWSGRENVVQTAYRIRVAQNANGLEGKEMWDSGKTESDTSTGVCYGGPPLGSCTEYVWTVTVWDNYGNMDVVRSFFGTGLREDDWRANWVEPQQVPAFHEPSRGTLKLVKHDIDPEKIKMNPTQMIRKNFSLKNKIHKGRLYVTAHGIYTARINGRRVGNVELAPGNTSYRHYLEYQAYDVTNLIKSGENAIGITIADGWWSGKVGLTGLSCQYGDRVAALFQIDVEYEDGSREVICSDSDCKSHEGPERYADLFVGEKYDARLEQDGFSTCGFDARDWTAVTVKEYGFSNLRAQYGGPVKVCKVLRPVKVWKAPNGDVLLDTGQVLAGKLRMRVRGEAGCEVRLEHTETLDKQGNYLRNILGVYTNQQDTYILKGGEEEEFEPMFTYHGFRYVRITGYPRMPTVDDFDVLVICSEMEDTGRFVCSDDRLNRLQHNIYWSQISNMVSIPTDCPQREKGGWLGDAQIYAPTASYNTDTLDFFKRWLRNMREDQLEDGQVPVVVPYISAYYPGNLSSAKNGPKRRNCSAAWGDACVILPWELYQAYGDISVLRENYAMIQKWLGYVEKTARTEFPDVRETLAPARKERMNYLWNTNFHYGDWLTPSVSFNFDTGDVDMVKSAYATMDIVPSCFFAFSTSLAAKIASILGKEADTEYYERLHGNIKKAFLEEFYTEEGFLKTELQGVYVLALRFGLVPEGGKQKLIDKLVSLIEGNGWKLDTGIVSVPYLLDVLTEAGRADAAYRLLFQDQCPSWLYMVKMGATSIWEAWQAIMPDGTPTTVSYNHYAFGCVGDWMYRTIAGITALEPGYKKICFEPRPGGGINWAKGCYDSVYGRISCKWRKAHGLFRIEVTVPPNATASVVLPNGKCIEIGSGKYYFTCPVQ